MTWNRTFGGPLSRRRDYPPLPHLDLRQRLHVLVLVRYAVAVAVVLGSFFAAVVVGIRDLNVGALCALAGALLLCNMATHVALRPLRHGEDDEDATQRFMERVLHFSVAADYVLLTVALWLVGGAFSPFKAFFIFNVIISSVLLSPRAAFTHALVAYALITGLVIGTWRGWLPVNYPEGVISAGTDLTGDYVFTVLAVQGLLIMLTALLTVHLMQVLRANTQALVEANEALAQVSQLRRDFLRLALHNLRSPVGAVSMHLSNLSNGYGGPLTEEQQTWVGRSQCRLHDLTRFLHDLECLAALETGSLEHQAERVEIGPLAAELAEENRDLVEQAGHTLAVAHDGGDTAVRGIPRLIREAMANYLTNAIKYTPRGGHITLRVLDEGATVRVGVEDTGIGIAEADLARLFHQFVRIPVKNSSLGAVSGSGLGLYIVRHIAEMHGATVGVTSREGEGSTFSIAFPKAGPVETKSEEPRDAVVD